MSENSDVIDYIQKYGKSIVSLVHPYYGDGSRESIAEKVNSLLGLCKTTDAQAYTDNFVTPAPFNGEDEMSDQDYYDFMVWHRGLAVPMARDLANSQVKRGKQLSVVEDWQRRLLGF